MDGLTEVEAIRSLVAAVCVQAITDWKSLCYGLLDHTKASGHFIYRKEVYGFLASSDFATFLNYVCPGISMDAVDDKLRLREERVQTFVVEELTRDEREILTLLADNGMNASKAAEVGGLSRATVNRRINSIRSKTGVDPLDFWGLKHLLSLIEGG